MRLIDADKAKEVLTKLLYETAMNNSGGASLMCEDIAEHRLETWFGLVPTVDAVPKADYDHLLKRFKHLIQSDYIKSFDAWDSRKNDYVLDIRDAVEVVRCKDCKFYWKNNRDSGGVVCLATPKDDAFCSEGERKDDD